MGEQEEWCWKCGEGRGGGEGGGGCCACCSSSDLAAACGVRSGLLAYNWLLCALQNGNRAS